MKTRLPPALIAVVALQIIPPLILPPTTLRGISPVLWLILVALFALLGVSLLRLKVWSRTASIFIQGFNIIIRVLVVVSQGVKDGKVDGWLIGTSFLSMALSAVILYYIDQPDIQVLMQ